jgi:peroxiredoxin
MSIKAGERMPAGKFKTPGPEGAKELTTDELFRGKKVVLFSVPGRVYSDLRCEAPARVRCELADQLKAKGVDTLACLVR